MFEKLFGNMKEKRLKATLKDLGIDPERHKILFKEASKVYRSSSSMLEVIQMTGRLKDLTEQEKLLIVCFCTYAFLELSK